jgi:inorganic phosphate transporter, PiT family
VWYNGPKVWGATIGQLPLPLIVFLGLTLLHAFFNGMNNSGALVAAPISTRSLPPRTALAIALVGEFTGPFIFGVAVAATIGRDFLRISAVNVEVLLAAASSVITWNIVTWFFGVPSSSSHALAGGLIGASWAAAGSSIFMVTGLLKILGGLLLGPVIGLLGGYLLLKLVLFLVQGASPGVNAVFRGLQMLTTFACAMGHGTNDGQKSMGLITLGLVILHVQSDFVVPSWVTLMVALAMALGVASGGYRIIRTLGAKIYRIRPVHGFASQAASASIILASSLIGLPVSSAQVIGTAIMGVGSATRLRAVRWGVAGQIVGAWLVTIPVTAALGGLIFSVLRAAGA